MTIPLTMRPGEQRNYLFDFHLFPEISVDNDTLASVTSITGGDSSLLMGPPSIVDVIVTDADGTSTLWAQAGVKVFIAGGTDGLAYELLCTAVTAASSVLICEGTLYIGQPRTA